MLGIDEVGLLFKQTNHCCRSPQSAEVDEAAVAHLAPVPWKKLKVSMRGKRCPLGDRQRGAFTISEKSGRQSSWPIHGFQGGHISAQGPAARTAHQSGREHDPDNPGLSWALSEIGPRKWSMTDGGFCESRSPILRCWSEGACPLQNLRR